MKTAQIIFTLTAVALVWVIFTLASNGDLHPFYARAYLGLVYATWIFLALMSYHFKRPTK